MATTRGGGAQVVRHSLTQDVLAYIAMPARWAAAGGGDGSGDPMRCREARGRQATAAELSAAAARSSSGGTCCGACSQGRNGGPGSCFRACEAIVATKRACENTE